MRTGCTSYLEQCCFGLFFGGAGPNAINREDWRLSMFEELNEVSIKPSHASWTKVQLVVAVGAQAVQVNKLAHDHQA